MCWKCCARLEHFPFVFSDLHTEAPGPDSVLHCARDRWERSSLPVCPRGKANIYLDISLLCPFFNRLSLSAAAEAPLYLFVGSTAMFALLSPSCCCASHIPNTHQKGDKNPAKNVFFFLFLHLWIKQRWLDGRESSNREPFWLISWDEDNWKSICF